MKNEKTPSVLLKYLSTQNWELWLRLGIISERWGGGTSLCRHHTKFRRAPPKRWPVSYCLWFRYPVSTSGQRTLILTEISFYFRAKMDQSEDKWNPAREGRQCKRVYGRASYVQLCSISKSLRGTGGPHFSQDNFHSVSPGKLPRLFWRIGLSFVIISRQINAYSKKKRKLTGDRIKWEEI